MKCHELYKNFIEELYVLEDYFNLKDVRKSSPELASERSGAPSSQIIRGGGETSENLPTGNSETGDIGHRCKKILKKIPEKLHVYIP